MGELLVKNFHSGLKNIEANKREMLLLADWTPAPPRRIVGAHLGLLCYPTEGMEIYICVSRSPALIEADNFLDFKKDYLFYAQRDAYTNCSGIKDLLDWQMLPSGKWFSASKKNPVYVKVAVSNISGKAVDYDAWVNFYYETK